MLTFTVNTTENSCHFGNCDYNIDGKCQSYQHRLDCLTISLEVLCAEENEKDLIEKISKNKKDFLE
jgi:hypothetical protein